MRKGLLFILFLLLTINLQMLPRYYNPDIGRFTSADTVTPGGRADLQGLNRYSYCLNNPIKYIDPTGHEPDSTNVKYDDFNPLQKEIDIIIDEIEKARKGKSKEGVDTNELFLLFNYMLRSDNVSISDLREKLSKSDSLKNDKKIPDKKISMDKNKIKTETKKGNFTKTLDLGNWSESINNLNSTIPKPVQAKGKKIEKENEKKKIK